jgi:hypothetical protein
LGKRGSGRRWINARVCLWANKFCCRWIAKAGPEPVNENANHPFPFAFPARDAKQGKRVFFTDSIFGSKAGVTPGRTALRRVVRTAVEQDGEVHHIELNLRDIDQLFNTMDPSPFHEKDLDHDAEEFILSWAQEFNLHEPVELIIHFDRLPEERQARGSIASAVHNYFAYRARLNQLEFKRLMKQGRATLLVGLLFLGACLGLTEFLPRAFALADFAREGLTIAGWVAMWKPMEIYLYDWWPVRRRGKVFAKLSRMPVHVHQRDRSKPAPQANAAEAFVI